MHYRSGGGRVFARVATVAVAAVSLIAGGLPAEVDAKTAKPKKRTYIVQMAREPVVAYDGGIAGLAPTEPREGRKIDPTSPRVVRYADFLGARHDAALERVGGGEKLYDFVYSFDGFAAVLTAAQAKDLRKSNGVLAVTRDKKRSIDTSSTPSFLELDARGGLWHELGGPGGTTTKDGAGEDVVIGIIDTGIWPESLSFTDRRIKKNNTLGQVIYQEIEVGSPPDGWAGTCVAGEDFDASRCNRKLIGGRHFNEAWGGDEAIEASMPWEFTSARDYNGHGSHTASTAGGNYNVPTTGPASVYGPISGIAPRARIAAYKALWSTEDASTAGGFTSDLVAAIDSAVADGVDVINYSVSGATSTFLDPVDVAFMFAADAGIFVSASAGNNGPSTGTVAHPGPWETTVAAGTHNREATGSVTLGNGDTYEGASVADPVGPAPLIDSSAAGLPGAVAWQVALCYTAADAGGSPVLDPDKVAGKIVVCDRGITARVNKSLAVAEAGGVGVILANTVPNSLNADFHFVPTVHVADTHRATIKEYAATDGATATINQSEIIYDAPAPATASFSSRGPLTAGGGNLLKPDVIAPGQDILAAVAPPGHQGGSFNLSSGTSMSAPHVAGLAALLKDLNQDWSPMAIKSALMTTGTDVTDGPGTDASVIFSQGAGHVAPTSAADPGLVYDSDINDWLAFLCGTTNGVDPATCDDLSVAGYSFDPSDFNSPSIAIGRLEGTQTVTRRVTNVSAETATYSASVDGLDGISTSVSPDSLTLDPGETESFTVTFTWTDAPLHEYAGGGLTWTDGEHGVRSPIVIRPRAERPSAEQWEARYNGDADNTDIATDITMDPQDRRVYVAGSSYQPAPGTINADFATIAYDPATGDQLWAATYNGPGNRGDEPADMDVSPDGSMVFVTGLSDGVDTSNDWATIAYDSATGAEQWVARHDGPANGADSAGALAVSPDGGTLYVTGMVFDTDTFGDYATIAYDTTTGEQLWISEFDSQAEKTDDPRSIGVSPDGSKVFVSGQSGQEGTGSTDWGTVAYDSATGDELWVKYHNGSANGLDIAGALTLTPDSSTLLVTGSAENTGTQSDWATVAYDTDTGEEQWAQTYDGPASSTDVPRALVLDPSGTTLVVTGNSSDNDSADWATVAYTVATGEQIWSARHNGTGNGLDIAWGIAMTPDGAHTVVTGQSIDSVTGSDYATIAYDTATGEEEWAGYYDGPASAGDVANAVAIGSMSPALGLGVFVTGESAIDTGGSFFNSDFATVAYLEPWNSP